MGYVVGLCFLFWCAIACLFGFGFDLVLDFALLDWVFAIALLPWFFEV